MADKKNESKTTKHNPFEAFSGKARMNRIDAIVNQSVNGPAKKPKKPKKNAKKK